MFTQDYVLNGIGHGPFGSVLGEMRFDPHLLRPFIDENGRKVCTVNTGKRRVVEVKDPKTGIVVNRRIEPVLETARIKDLRDDGIDSPVFNATSLTKEQWIFLDKRLHLAARYRLRAWADLARESSFGGFNGMNHMILEHETITDPGEALVDMDALTEGRSDEAKFQLQGVPLTITHSDFWVGRRRQMISQNSGTAISTRMGEAAARRIAESIEKTTIGNNTGLIYGGNSTQVGGYGRTSQVYGYTNFPPRVIYNTLHKPTTAGWTPAQTLADVLAMRDKLTAQKFYGPFMLYHSNDWDQYMDTDYILTGGNVATQTLRRRLMAIGEEEGAGGNNKNQILGVRRLDFLFATPPTTNVLSASYTGPGGEGVAAAGNPFTLILVQMTSDVAEAVNGQDITVVQWESVGGMRLNFKCFAIQVPRLFADAYNNCGILHATTA